MKKFIMILFISGLLFSLMNCKDHDIGFLTLDANAGFQIDSVIVYQDPPASSNQARYGSVYATDGAISGVYGTLPITYSLYEISSTNGNVSTMLDYIEVKEGSGRVVIPNEHNIVLGDYFISIQIENVYGTVILENALRIIVKE